MSIKERYAFCIRYFKKHQPSAETELRYKSPFELLVAVILSAQCTDKRVNLVTPPLFEAFPNALKLSNAAVEEVYEYVKSISYPNNKAKHLVAMSKKLIEDYDGIVPEDIQDLQKLNGVGRKTANVIASVVYNQPKMAVDTHVFRVSARIGLTKNAKTPLETEKQLIKHIPKEYVHIAHHWLILHGRYVCTSRKPHCKDCKLKDCCEYYRGKLPQFEKI